MLPHKTKARRSRRPDFAIVGTGQLARVLAHALHDAGYKIREIVSRDLPESKQRARRLARQVKATARVFASAEFNARVIWLCIPDDFVSHYACATAARKTDWEGQIMIHSSGALSSRELENFRRASGSVASAHPLMSFVPNSPATLKNIPIALEGEAKAIAVLTPVLRCMRTSVFKIEEDRKPAYHTFGAFASPLLIAYFTQMEAAGELAGLGRKASRDRAAAILQQTLTNYVQKGPAEAFSGPLRRGDVGTIQKHLQVLQQDAKLSDFYRELVKIGLRELPVKNVREIEELLEQKTATGNSYPNR
jgi:predicted short-subunit dehydrogenase-like oxidoreductase (DUF2520 family)